MKMKFESIWSVCFWLCILVIGCSGSIHNIRKNESEVNNKDDQLKIMTFNIRVGCGRDDFGMSPYRCMPKKENSSLVAIAIKSEDPDVVALQEVKGYNQVKYIAETLNMNFAYIAHGGKNS